MEGFIAASRAKGCAPKSIRNYLGTLHSIFEFAKVRPNPVTDARKPEAEDTDPDIRFLTEEELEALLRAVPDDHLGPTDRALYLTAALTGLRQGEAVRAPLAGRRLGGDEDPGEALLRPQASREGGPVRKAEVQALDPLGADA